MLKQPRVRNQKTAIISNRDEIYEAQSLSDLRLIE
jgi:hypothetical protein